MKYKIINSDILLKGKLVPENSEVELSTEETKGIEDYLIQKKTEDHTEPSQSMTEASSTNNEQKIKNKWSKK